jgi:hypothetical protein
LKYWWHRHAKSYRNDGCERNRGATFLIAMVPQLCKVNICTKTSHLFDGKEILTAICPPEPILVHRSNQPGIDRQSELKDGAAW